MLLENAFELDVAPESVWAVLLDVPRIVPCIPGAELVETRSETEWIVRVKVKLGAMGMDFINEITMDARDDQGRRVHLNVKGRDVAGRGIVTAGVESVVSSVGDRTSVEIATDLVIAGKMAQFGRGIVADVSASLVDSFAACLRAQLLATKAQPVVADQGGEVPASSLPQASGAMSLFALMRGVLWRRLRRLISRLRVSTR